tara:strand:- start:3821 stop:4084 length:264 start_codon:yes stop_codon:yes gene_type:complete
MLRKGDFVKTGVSNYPCVVVSTDHNRYLLSIREYRGDYASVYTNSNTIEPVFLTNYEKLSEIGKFGGWWIDTHKDIFIKVLLQILNT